MSRNKRKTSALQAVAVTTISALFILTALFGLYKCFSQEPTLRPSGPAAPDPDPSAAQEPENPEDDARPLSSEERKEHFYTVLMAGLDGIENQIDPAENGWGPYDFNLYTLSEEEQKRIKGLPKSLDEALDALEADHDYLTKGGVFPQRLIDVWVERKRAELKKMEQIPNPAEFKMYYDL